MDKIIINYGSGNQTLNKYYTNSKNINQVTKTDIENLTSEYDNNLNENGNSVPENYDIYENSPSSNDSFQNNTINNNANLNSSSNTSNNNVTNTNEKSINMDNGYNSKDVNVSGTNNMTNARENNQTPSFDNENNSSFVNNNNTTISNSGNKGGTKLDNQNNTNVDIDTHPPKNSSSPFDYDSVNSNNISKDNEKSTNFNSYSTTGGTGINDSNSALSMPGMTLNFDSAIMSSKNSEKTTMENLYIETLSNVGLCENDISRVLNGEITLDNLLIEIENDSNSERYQEIMDHSMIQEIFAGDYNYLDNNYKSSEDIEKDIENIKIQLTEAEELLKDSEKELKEVETILNITIRLKEGESLENILKEPVAWSSIDEQGNENVIYNDPYINTIEDDITYDSLTFDEAFEDSNLLEGLTENLKENTVKNIFNGTEKTIHNWEESNELASYLDDLYQLYDSSLSDYESNNTLVEYLKAKISTLEGILQQVYTIILHYVENVHIYQIKDDFSTNTGFSDEWSSTLNRIKEEYADYVPEKYGDDGSPLMETVNIEGIEDTVNMIACLINECGITCSQPFIFVNGNSIFLSAENAMLRNYIDWIPVMTIEEKDVFNYIYNTEGYEAAYKYLEDISDTLDTRWYETQCANDAKFAAENKAAASLLSVLITPVEGINALYYAKTALNREEKIRRSDVYSSGDVYLQSVSQIIANNHGNIASFLYGISISMLNAGELIIFNSLTGGALAPLLTATLMGSRSYVSSLNSALDKGLSDQEADLLATANAITEIAMESISLGHFMNLEGNFSNITSTLAKKIAERTSNEVLVKVFCGCATALSQAIVEADEEFCTEILNYISDAIISGDLSDRNTLINNYLLEGKSLSEATSLADKEFGKQLGLSYLGGFISGGCFGGFSAAKSTHYYSKIAASEIYARYEGTESQKFASVVNLITETNSNNEGIVGKLNSISKEVSTLYNLLNSKNNLESPSSIIYTASEGQAEVDVDLDRIKDPNISSEEFSAILATIRDYTEENIPKNYATISDYKAYLMNDIILPNIEQYDNLEIYELTKDKQMFEILLNSEVGIAKLAQLYTDFNNLVTNAGIFSKTFSNLTTEQLNTLFNQNEIQDYINTLDINSLSKLINGMSSTGTWLEIDTIINKITTLNQSDFYTLLSNASNSINDSVKTYLKSGKDIKNYVSLLESINNKFYAKKYIVDNIQIRNAINCVLVSNTNNVEINTKIKEIQQTQQEIEKSLAIALLQKSSIKLNAGYLAGNLIVEANVDKSSNYYDLVVSVDGEQEVILLKQKNGKIDLLSEIIKTGKYDTEIRYGKFEIKSLEVNEKISSLNLNSTNGYMPGINEVILDVDGKQITEMIRGIFDTFDLYESSGKLKSLITEASNVSIVSVKSLGDLDVQVENSSNMYIVSYEQNGEVHNKFMTVVSDVFKDNYLPINDYITKNNLSNISNIKVREATSEEIKTNYISPEQMVNGTNVFASSKYGGNQSNVSNYLSDYLEGNLTGSPIIVKEAELLNEIANKYFKEITDSQKKSLAQFFSEGGCCWTAIANAFISFISSTKGGSNFFKDRFGFDLTIESNEELIYNIEPLAFDMFCSYYSNLYGGNVQQIFNSEISGGISSIEFDSKVINYFLERGVSISANTSNIDKFISPDSLKNSILSTILNNTKGYNILSASNFDLMISDMDTSTSLDKALANVTSTGNLRQGVGSHSMLITNITEIGDLTVSTWGKKADFILDSVVSNLKNGIRSSVDIWTIEFSLPETNEISSNINLGTNTNKMESVFESIKNNIKSSKFEKNVKSIEQIIVDIFNTTGNYSIDILDNWIEKGDTSRIPNQYLSSINNISKNNNAYYIKQCIQQAKINLLSTQSNVIKGIKTVIQATEYKHPNEGLLRMKTAINEGNPNYVSYPQNKQYMQYLLTTYDKQFLLACLRESATISHKNLAEIQRLATSQLNFNVYNKIIKVIALLKEKGKYIDAYNVLNKFNRDSIRSYPYMEKIQELYERFDMKYYVEDQATAFTHFQTRGFQYKYGVSQRLYLNLDSLNDTISFAILFANKCEERGLPFYFKTANMRTSNFEYSNLIRDESIVIYSNELFIAEYVNICNEIRIETGMAFKLPPVLTGVIDGFIGYGEEFKNHDTSYNRARSDLIDEAIESTNHYFEQKYQGFKNFTLSQIINESRLNIEYIQAIIDYIFNHSKEHGINPQNFILNIK